MSSKLELEKIVSSKRLSPVHIFGKNYTPAKSRRGTPAVLREVSVFSGKYENKYTHDLQNNLKNFVIAFLKEQPDDIIDYAVMHFKAIQQKRGSVITSSEDSEDSHTSDDGSSITSDFDAMQQLSEELRDQDSHRLSVFSEIYDSCSPSASSSNRTIIPKTDSQRNHLLKSILDNFIFQTLEKEKLYLIADAMYEMVVKEGERLITQGEEGDNFYVIEKGTFNVIKNDILISTLNEGTFGEMALLYSAPREATIEAATTGRLWVIDRETFRKILFKHALQQQEKYEELVYCVPLIKSLDKYHRMKLLEHLETVEYPAEAHLMHAGEDVPGLYFIIEGQVAAYYSDGVSKEIFIRYLGRGNYFGDIELILKIKVHGNIYATTDVKLALLKPKYFKSCLGEYLDQMLEKLLHYEIKDDYLIDRLSRYIQSRKEAKEIKDVQEY